MTVESSSEHLDHLWSRRCSLVYRARLSALYHRKRERFFDAVDKVSASLTALAASAAAAAVLGAHSTLEPWAALTVAALSLVPLVLSPGLKARHHAALAAEFKRLLADLERAGQFPEQSLCDAFAARIADIEAGEPAPLGALVADCQNQLALAHGGTAVAALGRMDRLLMHLVDRRPAPAPQAQR